jgi:hypothetical protein
MELDPKETAIFYQGHARHYSHWQQRYRDNHMLKEARKMQWDAAIAAETAMDYLERLLIALKTKTIITTILAFVMALSAVSSSYSQTRQRTCTTTCSGYGSTRTCTTTCY